MPRINVLDPLARQPEHGVAAAWISPMSPPEVFAPPALEKVSEEELHPFLRRLHGEHAALGRDLDALESALQQAQEQGFDHEVDHAIMLFLQSFDRSFVVHVRVEEASLFPLLRERLLEAGEHSRAGDVRTPVDVMISDHLSAVQLAAVVLNLLRLGTCLPDERSAGIVIEAALREASNLVELLRLHMFREDGMIFPLAQRLVSPAELDALAPQDPKRP